MTIEFTMTSRMMAVAGVCALLLCIVLFVLGVQIGAQYGRPAAHASASNATIPATVPLLPADALPAENDIPTTASSADAPPSSPSDTSKP